MLIRCGNFLFEKKLTDREGVLVRRPICCTNQLVKSSLFKIILQ